ncbi:MAG TPA: hypothetical protein DIW54_00405, partial [Chitinophagaceae bacterium]|nr:hypothetical protein [Chitinophagaceae bacterium]
MENANKGDWARGGDHTGDNYGNMFLVNAGGNNSLFFRQNVTGLCTGTIYNFSAWIANVNSPNTQTVCGNNLVYARVIFRIKDLSGNILASYTTNTLPLSPTNGPLNWIQYGFQFTLPVGVSGLTLEMVDFYGGGAQCGNDLALDDILFTACTPALKVSINSTGNICAGATATISSAIQNSPYANPAYQWQRSINNGTSWVNVGGAGTNNNNLIINNTSNGDSGLYRLIVGPDVNSLASSTCIATSNSVRLRVISSPQLSITGATSVCDSSTLQLTPQVTGGNAPFSYTWTGPAGFSNNASSAIINAARSIHAGNYQVIVQDVNGCTDTSNTTVSILDNPAIAPITGDSVGCVNTTIQLSSAVSGGIWASNHPSFVVNQSGKVSIFGAGTAAISYTTSNNFCSLTTQKTIYSNSVQLPADFIECNNSAVVVNTNNDYKPTYSNNLPTDKYSWQISGGPYNYIGGTDSTERFPKFKLEGGNIYRIVLGYSSNNAYCTDTMLVYRDVPVMASINTGNDTIVCANINSIQLTAFANGPITGYNWSSSGTGSFSNTNIAQTTYTFSAADKSNGNVRFYLQVNLRVNGICATDNKDTIQVLIQQPPTLSIAGNDRIICLQDTIHLNGNTPTHGNGNWSLISGPNTPIIQQSNQANTSVGNLAAGTYRFVWTIANSPCGINTDTVVISIANKAETTNAGKDSVLCLSNSFKLYANNINTGIGTWRLISGPSSLSFSNINDPAATISNMIAGTYQLEWMSSNGVCAPSRDTVQIQFTALPSIANAGTDQLLCYTNTIQLNAQIPSVGNGVWSIISGPNTPTLQDSTNATTTLNSLQAGDYRLRWIVNNGACASTSDSINITIRPAITIASTGTDTSICGWINGSTKSIWINSNKPSNQQEQGLWHIISQPGAATLQHADSNHALLNIQQAGDYLLEWRIQNDAGCSTADTLAIIVTAQQTTGVQLRKDTAICYEGTANLQATLTAGNINRWQYRQAGSSTWTDSLFNGNSLTLQLLRQSIEWRVISNIQVNGCSSTDTSNSIRITVLNKSNAGILSRSDTLCYNNNNGQLQLNGYTGNILFWQFSENGGQSWQQINQTASTLSYSNLTTTRWYRAIVQNGNCAADTSNLVSLTVLPNISNNSINSSQQICIGQSYDTIRGSMLPAYAMAIWQYNQGNGWQNSSQTNPLALIPDTNWSSAQIRRIVQINQCASDTSNIITLQKNISAKVRIQNIANKYCAPIDLSTQIQLIVDSNIQTYQWWVNNQLIHSGSNTPNIRLLQPNDSLLLSIIGIHRFGCANDTLTQWFYTNPAIQAGFHISDTTICGLGSIQFTNETSDSTLRFEWDFGNGSKSTSYNPPAQNYSPASSRMDTTYRVTLTVFSICDTVQIIKIITVKGLPIASMIASPSFGCSPLDVQFTNQSKGIAQQYKLIFDDGEDTTMTNFTHLVHTYHTGRDRTYYAKLIAFNSCGTDTNNIAVPVRVTPNPTVLRITAKDSAACGTLNATFINNTVRGGTFTWEFG